MLQTKVITSPEELLLVADVKAALAVTFTDDDTLLESLISASRETIEKYCGISIGSQSRECYVDINQWEEMEIPFGPVISLDAVSYKSDYGEYTAALSGEDYDSDGVDFLTFTPFTSGRWKLEYTAGYETLPNDLKNYWIRLVAWYYENRGDQGNIPEVLKKDFNSYKRLYFL